MALNVGVNSAAQSWSRYTWSRYTEVVGHSSYRVPSLGQGQILKKEKKKEQYGVDLSFPKEPKTLKLLPIPGFFSFFLLPVLSMRPFLYLSWKKIFFSCRCESTLLDTLKILAATPYAM